MEVQLTAGPVPPLAEAPPPGIVVPEPALEEDVPAFVEVLPLEPFPPAPAAGPGPVPEPLLAVEPPSIGEGPPTSLEQPDRATTAPTAVRSVTARRILPGLCTLRGAPVGPGTSAITGQN